MERQHVTGKDYEHKVCCWCSRSLVLQLKPSFLVHTNLLDRRQVNSFAREFINSGNAVDNDLHALELRLHKFNNALPSTLKAENLMEFQLAGPGQGVMLCFSIIHCANMICLHSTRVPSLTGVTRSSDGDSNSSQDVIIEMARIGGELIHEHISNLSKTKSIPPMTGYCVFAIGAVHAHMHEFRDGPGYSEAWIHGVSCLLFLEHMSTYWPVLEKLVGVAKALT